MDRIKFGQTLIGSILLLSVALSPSQADHHEALPLADKKVAHLRRLPYGVSGQTYLGLRKKHIQSVEFSGAGIKSDYGYVKRSGLFSRGLWLRLKNDGWKKTARGSIQFFKEIDGRRYNSLILWVKANKPNQKLRVSIKHWEESGFEPALAKTPIFNIDSQSKDRISQVVIPYHSFLPHGGVSFEEIQGLEIEFGSKELGNPRKAVVDIYGLAFVSQEKLPRWIQIIPSWRPSAQVVKKPKPGSEPGSNYTGQEIYTPEAESPPFSVVEKPDLPTSLKVKKAQAPAPPLFNFEAALKKLRGFNWPAIGANVLAVFFLGLGVLLLVRARRRKRLRAANPLGYALHEVKWLENLKPWKNDLGAEKDFWKSLPKSDGSLAWLSVSNLSLKPSVNEVFHGLNFLHQQIRLAKQRNINLIPSLCFVRTVYHFESFLARPNLYMWKKLGESELYLSDEELRVKHIGSFPVWIPPYWQKKNGMPQKVLVAFGKMPGAAFTSDSIQFQFDSGEFQKLTVEVLKKFAKVCKGVRIEGATSLLNESLELYWEGQLTHAAGYRKKEFWAEVTQAVKKEYRDFIFISDEAGSDAEALRRVGFHYFENDRVRETLAHQVEMGSVGNLESALVDARGGVSSQSIYNLTPLLRARSMKSAPAASKLIVAVLSSLLPGLLSFDKNREREFNRFIEISHRWPALIEGRFFILSNDTSEVFSFGRLSGKNLLVVVANFSQINKNTTVRMTPVLEGFEGHRLYLFNDLLFGQPNFKALKEGSSGPPAMAVLGQDLRDVGLFVKLSGLNLKTYSVTLSRPVYSVKTDKPQALARVAKV